MVLGICQSLFTLKSIEVAKSKFGETS